MQTCAHRFPLVHFKAWPIIMTIWYQSLSFLVFSDMCYSYDRLFVPDSTWCMIRCCLYLVCFTDLCSSSSNSSSSGSGGGGGGHAVDKKSMNKRKRTRSLKVTSWADRLATVIDWCFSSNQCTSDDWRPTHHDRLIGCERKEREKRTKRNGKEGKEKKDQRLIRWNMPGGTCYRLFHFH